ncbi:MAG: type I-U CRISPR-associated RAMP protein Csb1/Cas7u [Planctomycetota bacterium]|nr:type I-U CRISPR-associated RAMP protein Csb1/Cas7u [Planctomycetota bacterium]MDA1162300.1 type I-U CRISPR-associated RAMP protein Csb1/Cas7u [Planctomycetota bacterium]
MFDLKQLQDAVSGSAAAFRSRVSLQPAGGEGDKVFPPTYSGAVYATEKRRLPGRNEPVDCVLLDSVQSQANRVEEALQDAVDEGRICIPVIEVDFSDISLIEPGQEGDGLYEPIGRVTSLEAPHRVADAILRDSEDESGTAFRQTEAGRKIGFASLRNATPLFEICPTALLLGLWDSTGPKGGLGTKFQRALVSEIIGIDASYGTKTSSRIDPLGIRKDAALIYETPDRGWTLASEDAAKDKKKKPLLKGKDGKPSEANHGNIVPSLSDVSRDGQPLAGGVTISSAEQMTVLSLPALRRLQFPIDNQATVERNRAGRTVLAALGLCGAVLAAERGLDLRSRCLLWPTGPITWELLDRPGSDPVSFELDAETAIKLLADAVAQATAAGLPWMSEPLRLKPAKKLVDLVRSSQKLAMTSGGEGGDA